MTEPAWAGAAQYEVVPPGKLSIFATIGDYINRDYSLNENAINYYNQTDNVEALKELVSKFQSGERMVDLNDYPQFATFKHLAKLVVANEPIAGKVIEKVLETVTPEAAKEWRERLGLKPA